LVTDDADEPFTRDAWVDEPGFVGARWWQESLRSPIDRRALLKGLVLGGSVLAAIGIGVLAERAERDADPARTTRGDRRRSLELQKELGWNFGAASGLNFDASLASGFDRAALDRMVTDLEPTQPRHLPFYVRTLFESLTASPTHVNADGGVPPKLRDLLTPIHTPTMVAAYHAGRALADLLQKNGRHSMVVDLNGEHSIAFAAGAAHVFEPIFMFDNWPHPLGVVKSHLVLAAAAFYQALFLNRRAQRSKDALGMYVLDRTRLASYVDGVDDFDNRYLVRLPRADQLLGMGLAGLFYVVPTGADVPEKEDLNEVLFAMNQATTVRYIPANSFVAGASVDAGAAIAVADAGSLTPTPLKRPIDGGSSDAAAPRDGVDDDGPVSRYLGVEDDIDRFHHDYFEASTLHDAGALGTPPDVRVMALELTSLMRNPLIPYRIVRRSAQTADSDSDFATVPVLVAISTGAVVGLRSGSWNRTSDYSSTGGG